MNIEIGQTYQNLRDTDRFFIQFEDHVLHINLDGCISVLDVGFIAFSEDIAIAKIERETFNDALLECMDTMGILSILKEKEG